LLSDRRLLIDATMPFVTDRVLRVSGDLANAEPPVQLLDDV